MAMTEKLEIFITANAKGAMKEFDNFGKSSERAFVRSGKHVEGFGASMDKLSNKLISTGAKTTAFGAVVGAGLYKAAKAATEYGESVSKATAVFGNTGTNSLAKFADDAAVSMGKSRTEALDAASAYGLLLKQSGIGGAALAKSSSALAVRTADLAQQYKKPYEEVQAAIEKVLKTGTAKSLKGLLGLNIQIDPSKLKGLDTAAKTAKVLDLVLQQTSKSAGKFAKSAGTDLSVQAKQARASFDNLKESIGAGVAPGLTKIAQVVGHVAEAFDHLPKGVQEAVGSIGLLVAGTALTIGPLEALAGGAIKVTSKLAGFVSGLGAVAPEAEAAAAGLEGTSAAAVGLEAALGPIALVTAAIAGLAIGFGALGDQSDQAIARLVPDAKKIQAAFDPKNLKVDEVSKKLADALNPKKKVGPQTGAQKFFESIGVYNSGIAKFFANLKIGGLPDIAQILGLDDSQNKIKLTKDALKQLSQSVASLGEKKGKSLLDDVKKQLIASGVSAKDANKQLKPLYDQLNQDTAARRAMGDAAAGIDGVGGAADKAASKLSTLAERIKAAANSGSTLAERYKAVSQAINEPARTAIEAISATDRLAQAQDRLARLQDPARQQLAQADAVDKVTSAQNNLTDAIDRRNKAQQELDALTKKSVVAGSVPLVQEIARAADDAVAQAETAAKKASADYGAGSEQAVAAQNVVNQAKVRQTKTGDLLGSAVAEQQGINQGDIAEKRKEVARDNEDITRAQRGVTQAQLDYADAIKQTASDQKQALLDVASAQMDYTDAMAAVVGAAAAGDDPLGKLAGVLGDAGVNAGTAAGLIDGLRGALGNLPAAISAVIAVAQAASGTMPGVAGVTATATAQRQGRVPDNYGTGSAAQTGRAGGGSGGGGGRGWATGGLIPGMGNGDTVPAMLTPGEFVLTKEATQRIGSKRLREMNANNVQRFASGGLVGSGGQNPVLSTSSMGSGHSMSSAQGMNIGAINITTTDPKESARETVRRLRSASFLAGLR